MTAQPDVEVPGDDLLARMKKVTELNARIRRGLTEAERGETVDLGSFAQYADDEPEKAADDLKRLTAPADHCGGREA
jgi:hypothetical protein